MILIKENASATMAVRAARNSFPHLHLPDLAKSRLQPLTHGSSLSGAGFVKWGNVVMTHEFPVGPRNYFQICVRGLLVPVAPARGEVAQNHLVRQYLLKHFWGRINLAT